MSITKKLTYAPLPSWGSIFRSAFIKKSDKTDISQPWIRRVSEKPYWFSRSAFSLCTIMRWWEKLNNKQLENVWFPSYFCNDALNILRQKKYPLSFYPITSDLSPDWQRCESMLKKNKPDIFIFVHYFGFEIDSSYARKFCDRNNIILVEDAAHIFSPKGNIGHMGEFVLYSPHKFLPIPDGALLIHRPKTRLLKGDYSKKSVAVMEEVISSFDEICPNTNLWLLKRIIQKIVPNYILTIRNNQLINNSKIEEDVLLQSNLSYYLLKNEIGKIEEYSKQRKINSEMLSYFLGNESSSPLLKNKNVVPYIAALKYKSKESLHLDLNIIQKKRLPVMRWPDLPPEVIENQNFYKVANDLFDKTLFFPVHPTFDVSSYKYLQKYKNFRKNKFFSNDYYIDWQEHKNNHWDNLFNKSSDSNLLQSWLYGEAKFKVSKWKPIRGIIKERNTVLAIFQALQKSIGPFKIIRINKGPLFLDDDISENKIISIFRCLRKNFSIKMAKVLIISPNLKYSEKSISFLGLAGYKKLYVKSYHTSIIDLSLKNDLLRKNLNGKWRNQLKKSESFSIELKISNSEKSLSWILNQYSILMKQKSFQGPRIDFYHNLFHKNGNYLVFKAIHKGNLISGILVSLHGKNCTYQIGWNGNQGRSIYANNFLLWNAIKYMRNNGYCFFDLGGIDKNSNPGVAKFKTGIGGDEVTFIGDWISF